MAFQSPSLIRSTADSTTAVSWLLFHLVVRVSNSSHVLWYVCHWKWPSLRYWYNKASVGMDQRQTLHLEHRVLSQWYAMVPRRWLEPLVEHAVPHMINVPRETHMTARDVLFASTWLSPKVEAQLSTRLGLQASNMAELNRQNG
jgi:hypothetical protein